MKIIGRMLLLVVVLVTIGCDLEIYRTNEGIGILGPNGGYFWCDNNVDCTGQ